jgi:hypothetical protein
MDEALHPNGLKAQETWARWLEVSSPASTTSPRASWSRTVPAPVPGESSRGGRVRLVRPGVHRLLRGSWHQDGRCSYADDRCTISLVHETGTAPDGDEFDNMAIWVSRIDADGRNDRLWTVDLDQEHVTEFWRRNEAALKESRAG